MLFIITQPDGRVSVIHYHPELLTEEEKSTGLIVDSNIPPVPEMEGKSQVLYYDDGEEKFYYQEIDSSNEEKSEIERELDNFKQRQSATESALLDLIIMGGM